MATVLERKNGGPYSKKDQEKRRNQVYSLHFENGYSAIKIAETLDVNRNTINEDIKYWSRQIAIQFGKENLGETLCRQIERLDIQRRRLANDIAEQKDISKKIQLEKLLFEIDYKITGVISKVLVRNLQIEEIGNEEIPEEEISQILRKICLSDSVIYPESLDETDILKEVILITGWDERHSKNLFKCLKKIRLGLFEEKKFSGKFDLLEFSVARKFVTLKESDEIFEKRKEEGKKEESRLNEIENRYKKEYGSDESKWSKHVLDQMHDEMF